VNIATPRMVFANQLGRAITPPQEVTSANLAMLDATVLQATTPLVPAMALARAVSFALRDPRMLKVLATAELAIIAQQVQEQLRARALAVAAPTLVPAKAFAPIAPSVRPPFFMPRRWNTPDQSQV
jgi:phage-related tail protein